jgi:hypothetical protein
MPDEKKDKAAEKGKEKANVANDAAGDEGELTEVKPKSTGEPPDNRHKRSDWFQKRH